MPFSQFSVPKRRSSARRLDSAERAPKAARALARAIAEVERRGEAEPALVSLA